MPMSEGSLVAPERASLARLYAIAALQGNVRGMVYPGQFHKLVIIGDIYGEHFNTTLSIVPSALGELGMPPVTDAIINAVATIVSGWWTSSSAPSPRLLSVSRLKAIKLNRIGANGRYVDPETMMVEWGGLNGGYAISGNFPPAQISSVTTLRTRLERGKAARGRMYLPPTVAAHELGADGRVTSTAAFNQAEGVAKLIDDLNTEYTLVGKVGVASNAGLGAFEHVTAVAVGRVPDTMRSRRTSLVEDYQEVEV